MLRLPLKVAYTFLVAQNSDTASAYPSDDYFAFERDWALAGDTRIRQGLLSSCNGPCAVLHILESAVLSSKSRRLAAEKVVNLLEEIGYGQNHHLIEYPV